MLDVVVLLNAEESKFKNSISHFPKHNLVFVLVLLLLLSAGPLT